MLQARPECHDSTRMPSAGEVGLSRAVLAAGYNIASIQPEYAGLDFRKVSWEYFRCRGKRNPTFCCGPPGRCLMLCARRQCYPFCSTGSLVYSRLLLLRRPDAAALG